MKFPLTFARRSAIVFAGLLVVTLAPSLVTPAGAQYRAVKLVSDQHHRAAWHVDPNLINPWGVSFSPTSPFWVSNQGTGTSTLYRFFGSPVPLVVKIPPPAGSTATSRPTGQVFNGSKEFLVAKGTASAPALFIFATEDGTISGWSPAVDLTNAVLAVDNSESGAVYTGLAIASTESGNSIYAANVHDGVVEQYDGNFHWVRSFMDPSLPSGFAPFNVQNIGGKLYVTYATFGPGGYVDVFDTNGNMLQRFTSNGTLNAPWGLALAPSNFGKFSNALLVGNFGDGRINAFDASTGAFLGQLQKQDGTPIAFDGLWTLTFGNGHLAGRTNHLFFTAGVESGKHGLFGRIHAIHGF